VGKHRNHHTTNSQPNISDITLDNVFVMLTDWRGHIVWFSRNDGEVKVGDLSWTNLTPASQARTKEMHGKVATLREAQTLHVENLQGKHFRCWMWPLESPEIAVCILGREIPVSLNELSTRELECLELLALGTQTREIAEQLDLSVSTVHTHLTRAREKLGLANIEALISFAARYCYSKSAPLSSDPPA
jgi:DNA-binding CsgD family transcriptional regulator